MNMIVELTVFAVTTLPKVDFTATVTNVMRVVFGVIALLSILFVAFGGFKYVTSSGSPEGIRQAKDTIIYALIGLVVGLSASLIISFVLGKLG